MSRVFRGMASAGAVLAGPVAACPPPPPPFPSIEQQATTFRQAATALCVLRLRGDTLASTELPALRRWSHAHGHWQVDALVAQRLKGKCTAGRVYFAEVSPALCGGGMPPFDADLMVAMTDERVLVRWILADTDLARAVRHVPKSTPAPARQAER